MENYTFVEHQNSINLKHYSETCSNDHICKTTNAESAQANSHQNVTSDHFCESQMKKNLSKTTTTKLYPAKECKKNKEQFIKNKRLSDYIYSIANL